jgi:hypothetical protein
LPFTTPSMFLTIASTTSAMSPSTPPIVGARVRPVAAMVDWCQFLSTTAMP